MNVYLKIYYSERHIAITSQNTHLYFKYSYLIILVTF